MSTTTTLATATSDQVSLPLSSSSSSPTRSAASNLLSFSALTLSIFLVALDTVLIPTALASIAIDFHLPDSLYAWTGSAYLLANAASIPLWGRLSDVFGRKPVILIANAIFLVGSVVGGFSGSAEVLIAGRAVQGLGGGGVNVLVYVCVGDLFEICDRSFYMGIVGAMYAVASALGPVLGGIFAQKVSWRWCFYINIPFVSIAIITLYFTIHLPGARTSFLQGLTSIDWLGNLTILAATLFLLIGLQLGGITTYTSPSTLTLIILGILSYLLFPITQYLAEKRHTTPLTPLRIFRDTSNLSALGVCACDALVFNSVAYFLPLYFQLVLARSPSTSGVYMLAIAVPLATVSFLAGYIINKTGRYLEVLQCGLLLMTIGVGLLITLSTTLRVAQIVGFLLIIGIGFGPNFHAPLIALQTRIVEADMAAATAAFGFVRMVSGAVGVVVGQVAFQLLMRRETVAFAQAGVDVDLVGSLVGGEAISAAGAVGVLDEGARVVVREGMAGALRGVWGVYCGVSALGLVVSFGIVRGRIARDNGVDEVEQEKGRPGGMVMRADSERGGCER
ncbi:MFS general substrate transporter [Periconia macrospinosa]|uniref:MFS general substrate transporter n=1 Tax=Periconia macrospinosa TaxID=97972 RepID=A0A2V1DWN0_9PLEO|nr:MFS general substrate transporter [Periconia macrospinosa]